MKLVDVTNLVSYILAADDEEAPLFWNRDGLDINDFIACFQVNDVADVPEHNELLEHVKEEGYYCNMAPEDYSTFVWTNPSSGCIYVFVRETPLPEEES